MGYPGRVRSAKVERQTTLAEPCLPLSGVTVVESAAIIASPFGASMLADLGARVNCLNLWMAILSESWPSVWARLGVIPIKKLGDQSEVSEGQRIAQQLVANADIFIHNYRPGVPQRCLTTLP